jgi:uncharacterized protein YqeY
MTTTVGEVEEETDTDEWRGRLRHALTAAMKARDTIAIAALRSALSAIDNAEAPDVSEAPAVQHGVIAGGVLGLGAGEVARRTLSASELEAIVRREITERQSEADDRARTGHYDRAAALLAEAAVLAHVLGP